MTSKELEQMTARHEARIHEMDRNLAPGSETALLGDALAALRTAKDPDAELAWWVGAYRMVQWAEEYPERWSATYGDMWDDAYDLVLYAGEYWTGWTPPPPTPDDLSAWRERECLTQSRAAQLAGVELRAWQRWEGGDRAVPQWLADTLTLRWGKGP